MKIDTNSELKPLADFEHAFILLDDGSWTAYNVKEDHYCRIEDISEEFEDYKSTRPDYIYQLFRYQCLHVNSSSMLSDYDKSVLNAMDLSLLYENLIAYSMIANEVDQQKAWKRAMKLINWLRGTNFYKSPASTIYHEAYEGGLLAHTLTVATTILELQASVVFSSITSPEDALFVALVHDFCKIGRYQSYEKWVKDDNGQWLSTLGFKRVDSEVPFGHGECSQYIVQKFRSLKLEPALAIRWHMGAWRVTDSDMNDLQHSNEKFPLVHLLQFADQLAITDYVTDIREPFISV